MSPCIPHSIAFPQLSKHDSVFHQLYDLRQIARLLPSAEGTAEGRRRKFLNLQQLTEDRYCRTYCYFAVGLELFIMEFCIKWEILLIVGQI